MTVSFKITNMDEFKAFMEEKQVQMAEIIPESVKDATFYLQNKVKESIARGTNAPVRVDTGLFLNSVDFEVTGENEAMVFTNVPYAKYIEYGTSKMADAPHFRNTAMVEEANIVEVFKDKLKVI